MKSEFRLLTISIIFIITTGIIDAKINPAENYSFTPKYKNFLQSRDASPEEYNRASKKDSLPTGFTNDILNDLRDENGRKIIPDEGDAFQQRSFNGFAPSDEYGISVASAGDVNGDGYDDIIIGAPQNDASGSDAGSAYIYFGGTNVNSTVDVILRGEAANDLFGISVSSAGDVNGDGYADVIVGAYGNNSSKGRAYIFYGGAIMNNTADVILTGESANDYFGISVSSAGDVNGDGYADVVVGAYGYSGYEGRAYIFYGNPSMDNTADVTFTGETAPDYFGAYVSSAGDVNGDGYKDILIGASGHNNYTGRAYIFYGGTSMDNTADVILNGETNLSYFGFSVSSADDVNGDGYSDIIIGSFRYNSFKGRAYIFYGGASMDDVADVIFDGENAGDEFGYSVSSAGDVNGDGYSDVIIGAKYYNSYTGKAYIYFGGTSMNNTADQIFNGETTSTYFGSSVSKAGDVNGDGYSDVIIGAYGFNATTGKAYLDMYGMNGTFISELNMSGTAVLSQFGISVSSAGDVNGDGYSDLIVGAPASTSNTGNAYIFFGGPNMDNAADVTFNGEAANNKFGQSVSGAGDVNGDGYSDVIVGASGYGSSVGRAYIYYGGAVMNNVADVIITGESGPYYFGDAVAGAGDVNGDGYADVIVAADGYNSQTGRTYVYYGGAVMNNVVDVIMTGEAVSNWFGHSVSSAGDINNDGYSDIIIGAYGYGSNTGRAYIYFGGDGVMNNGVDIILTGYASNEFFGNSVSTAGDVNGDGIPDAIIGSNGYSSSTGRAYIYFGGTGLNNTPNVIITGESVSSSFGISVSTAGDVNGDGFSDVIVGASGGSSVMGKAYVYYGGAVMNNSADVTITGTVINTNFGNSVASADLNGDGSPDLIVGNYGLNSFTGKTFIYFTSSPDIHPNILSVNDVPGDQGSYVNLKWVRSSYDITVNGLVTNYLIERSIPPGAGGYQWVSAGTVPANQNTFYYYDARTGSDNNVFFFRVTALTNTATVKWRSNILSGYSIDNLAPLPPSNLMAAQAGNTVNLNWNRNSESDLRQYIIYRNGIQIGTSITLSFADNYFTNDSIFIYTIAAEDIHGNISGLSNQASVNLITSGINIKVIQEGFYNASKKLNMTDTVRAYLHSTASPYDVTDSAFSKIDSVTFTGIFRFSYAPNGSYFVALKHRNSIETWSAAGVTITSGSTVNFNMTSAVTQAFGNNIISVDNSPVRYAMFSGDVNQDGTIDLTDGSLIDNDAFNFASGYVPTDVNGDGTVDLSDAVYADNNGFNFVGKITP